MERECAAGQQRFAAERIVLFVHGATFPVAVAFDADLPGGSWMQNIAERGFDVYAVDVRGYGGSTRPAAMDQDPAANPPFAPTLLAVGEWDTTTPPAGAQELFKKLTGSRDRRLLLLSEGSHQMALEKNRMHLIRAVQSFLEEPAD